MIRHPSFRWHSAWTYPTLALISLAFIHTLFHYWQTKSYQLHRGNLKPIPMVTGNGWLPLLGHGLSFVYDMNGFLARCETQFGPIFKFQVFLKNFVIITDREFVRDFQAAKEEEMSICRIFEQMYFYEMHSSNKISFEDVIRIVIRKGVAANWTGGGDTAQKMGIDAKKLFERFENTTNFHLILSNIPTTFFPRRLNSSGRKTVDFQKEMRTFVENSNARILLGEPLSSRYCTDLFEFFKLFNIVIILSFIVPKPVIRLLFHARLCRLRDAAATGFYPAIQIYRDNPDIETSHILRWVSFVGLVSSRLFMWYSLLSTNEWLVLQVSPKLLILIWVSNQILNKDNWKVKWDNYHKSNDYANYHRKRRHHWQPFTLWRQKANSRSSTMVLEIGLLKFERKSQKWQKKLLKGEKVTRPTSGESTLTVDPPVHVVRAPNE